MALSVLVVPVPSGRSMDEPEDMIVGSVLVVEELVGADECGSDCFVSP